ncbi:Protein kinase-like (PK-like) [Glarea lozoyensis ATCC 20868]|uniref:Protein kinase-like (PK-like) n=1 Tax=Glarea lozoyensis (strain ATCC 20868 / MF5171) TaxID=1116229 RepID=S3DCJ5_GLAL2|nr:Protein kinase-like (PK-like) [Glarea lozoyensis ATCC 20868]EPE36142.1 Protein kinase-like (PK-like) [Glarea lozoyensis ATCC 20868]
MLDSVRLKQGKATLDVQNCIIGHVPARSMKTRQIYLIKVAQVSSTSRTQTRNELYIMVPKHNRLAVDIDLANTTQLNLDLPPPPNLRTLQPPRATERPKPPHPHKRKTIPPRRDPTILAHPSLSTHLLYFSRSQPFHTYTGRGKRTRSPNPRSEFQVVRDVAKYKGLTKTSAAAQREWLDSEPDWNIGLDAPGASIACWEGVRMLGVGGNGIVGLWKRVIPSSQREKGGGIPGNVNLVAVKQIQGDASDFEEEVHWMRRFQEGGRHTVRCYQVSKRERGLGTWRGMDDEGCLAKGAAIIENGNENLDGPTWDNGETENNIVHFDLKEGNVFLKFDDDEHTETPLFKIADFGLTDTMPKPEFQTERQYKYMRQNGTADSLAPEQSMQPDYPYKHYIGPPVTIWQIGKMMHWVVTRGRSCNPHYLDPDFLLVKLDENDTKFLVSMGELLLEAPYSVALRSLIFRCLACNWERRPNARELLADIEVGIETVDGRNGGGRSGRHGEISNEDGRMGWMRYPEPPSDPGRTRKKPRR